MTPAQGEVLLDGADVREVTVRSLREAVAVVSDDPLPVLRQRRREHRLRAAATRAAKRSNEAARRAQAHEFITACPRATTPASASAA